MATALQTAIRNFAASLSSPQPTKAPAAPAASPDAVARVYAEPTRREIYVIQATGVQEEAFGHIDCNAGLIYCVGGVSAGVLQQTSGATTYLGRTSQHLTEVRNQGEENNPFIIPETSLGQTQSASVWVKGTAGDKLILVYR